MIKNFFNSKGHQNPISGSKVTAFLLKGWILLNGGVSSGRVWICSLRSRLVFKLRHVPFYPIKNLINFLYIQNVNLLFVDEGYLILTTYDVWSKFTVHHVPLLKNIKKINIYKNIYFLVLLILYLMATDREAWTFLLLLLDKKYFNLVHKINDINIVTYFFFCRCYY